MNDFEKCFDAMNFKFNGKSAVCIDILSGDRWIYSDALIEGCKQNSDFFGYVCNQMFIVLKEHVKADGEDAQEVIEEMKKSAYSLCSFNDKINQFLLECKECFSEDKGYMLASEIVYLLNRARNSAFAMLHDTSTIINAFALRHSKHSNDIHFIQDYFSSDEFENKYKCINREFSELNSMLKIELNNIALHFYISDEAEVAA